MPGYSNTDVVTNTQTPNMQIAKQAFRSGGLVYPSDVGEMTRSKHYVQFFVNKQSHASASLGIGAYEGQTQMGRNNSNVSVQRAPTQRAEGSIALYMPSQLNVSHKINYGEAEIGAMVASIGAGITSLVGDGGEGVLQRIQSAAGNLYDGATAGGMARLAGVAEAAGATGARAAVEIAQGKVTNNRTEMKFEGIDRRAFNFTFRLLPRSSEEAERIQQIVSIFRSSALPEFDQSDTLKRTMIAPSTFDIRYMTIDANGRHYENPRLHRIGTSVLEGVDVKFGGDRPQFFYDGNPVETELTLVFKELEIMTKEKINEGY
jgi:hypothetical protein